MGCAVRFAARSLDELHRDVAQDPRQLAVAGGHVFVADNGGGRVLVLDTGPLETVAELEVPANPFGMTSGGGHV